jgi:hypothetical protein
MNYKYSFSSGLRLSGLSRNRVREACFFWRRKNLNEDFWKMHLRLAIAWLMILAVIIVISLVS